MQRRNLNFKEFSELLADVELLHESGYHQLGNWNLAQNLDHLRLTMESATIPKELGVPKFMQWVLKQFFLKKILNERKMKAGFKTAKKLLPEVDRATSSAMHQETAVSLFREAVNSFENHQEAYLPNPAFGKLSREDWRELQKVHCAHHLSFLVPKSEQAV